MRILPTVKETAWRLWAARRGWRRGSGERAAERDIEFLGIVSTIRDMMVRLGLSDVQVVPLMVTREGTRSKQSNRTRVKR